MANIIPSGRRIHQILRNGVPFLSRQAAMDKFTNIVDNADVSGLKDGEFIAVRYVAQYTKSGNYYQETTATSIPDGQRFINLVTLTNNVLTSGYTTDTIFFISAGGGKFSAYKKASGAPAANDDVTQYNGSIDNTIVTIKTLLGLVTEYSTTTGKLKVTFIGEMNEGSSNLSIYGSNAITVTDHTTGGIIDGKTVSLTLDSTEKVLSQSSNGLKTNLNVVRYTTTDYDGTALPTNVAARYRVKNGDTATNASSNIGAAIDILKDQTLYRVYVGHVDDQITSTTDPTVISGSGNDALCFIYILANGDYSLVAVDVESFLTESEFSDGLTVDTTNHIVKANLGHGLEFDSSSPKKIQAKLGTGLSFDTATPNHSIQLNMATTTSTTGIGGIVVGAVNSGAVTGNTGADAVKNAIVTDTTPTSSNGYKRYAVLRDSNGLAYVTVPNGQISAYMASSTDNSPITGLSDMLVMNTNGEMAILNVWDCGTYGE